MRVKVFAIASALLLSPFSTAFASSFSQLIAFGDSLSDNGNAFIASAGSQPGANYGTYSFAGGALTTQLFSDGPNTTPAGAGPGGVWVDQIAPKLGVSDPLPALAGGTDFAVGGAQTGTAQPQDLGNQVAIFSGLHPGGAPSTALYSFWAGANDILQGNNPVTAADNIASYITALHGEGANDFVWLNLPLLGDTPGGQANKAALNAASGAFDTEWAADVALLKGSGVHVTGVDMKSLFSQLLANPAKFGLTNVTAAAQGQSLPSDAGYLFWDGRHPTSAGHALVADAVDSALVATPEPASLDLAILGAFAAAGLVVKRRAV